MPKNLAKLEDVYRFELIGEENIAMQPSYIINIKSKDEFRYDRKVWVEKQNFLPLKVAAYDELGATLEQMVFTDQEVMDRLSFVDVKLPEAADPVQPSHPSQNPSPDRTAFILTRLPAGFRKVFFSRKPMHHSGQLVDHLVLSDGLASVSVYMENQSQAMQAGLQSVGAVSSFSHIMDNYLLTVMGEVPATTVKMIAENIRLRDSEK
jgi:sigma-E factor negative regulatory protein RseB